jgi:glycosyltransferase involved in cell wall biosynthesis
VLVVHNSYLHRGGEDAVAEAEVALLRKYGHAVQLLQRDNREIEGRPAWQLARETLWSAKTTVDIRAAVADFQPDLIHVHNSFPLVSPSVYWVAHALQVPVVQTLHNFRLICPQALMLRGGRVCEDCVGKVPWRAVLHRCYRGSTPESAAVAGMVQLHRAFGTWHHKVTLYVALNSFCRDKFIAGGLPAERIRIKPNFIDLPAPPEAERNGFLFAGRLSQEKGLGVLARALQSAPSTVRVAGEGPDAAQLAGLPGAQMLGALTSNVLYAEMARAQALLVPSIWYENFPRTLVEAGANGLPVIASRLGALPSLVQDGETGLLFEPGDGADLARKMQWAASHPAEMARMGRAARQRYEREWTGAANHRTLVTLYDEAVRARQTLIAARP